MASRYWVGGTGTWDASSTTHWSATSGGAGGASVPTSADDVFLNGSSGTGIVTTSAASTCKSLTCTGYAGTLAGGVTVAGSVTLASGMVTASGTVAWTATATGTFTSAGRTLKNSLVINAPGGTVTLGDALSLDLVTGGVGITHTAGAFDSASFAISAQTFTSSNSNTRALTLGSSAVTLTATGTAWDTGTTANLTVTANTAVVTFTGASGVFATATANFNGMSVVFTGSGTPIMGAGTATIANFTRTGTAAKTCAMSHSGNLVCTGTYRVNSDSDVNRVLVQSSVVGTARTITAAAVVITNTVDFQDITGAGAATWTVAATGATALGDCGGNSGITFTTPATQYKIAGGLWSAASGWSLTSGGGATGRVPLPQDDVVLNAATAATSPSTDMPRLGKSINCTGYTGTLNFSSQPVSIYGSLIAASAMTLAGSQPMTLAGRGTYVITSAGKTWGGAVFITAPGGTYTLTDAFADSAASGLVHTAGTLDTAGFAVTTTVLVTTGSLTRALTLGSSTVTLTGTAASSVWNVANTAGLTLSAASSTIVISTTSANSRTFDGGGQTYGTLTYTVAGSTGALNVNGANTFAAINFSDATNARTLRFQSGVINRVAVWNVNGTASKLMTVASNTGGSPAFLQPTTTGAVVPFVSDYLAVQDITARSSSGGSGTGLWYAGTHSTNVSGNTGWLFNAYVHGAGSSTATTSSTGSGHSIRHGSGASANVTTTTSGAGHSVRHGSGASALVTTTSSGSGVTGRIGSGGSLVTGTSSGSGTTARHGAGATTTTGVSTGSGHGVGSGESYAVTVSTGSGQPRHHGSGLTTTTTGTTGAGHSVRHGAGATTTTTTTAGSGGRSARSGAGVTLAVALSVGHGHSHRHGAGTTTVTATSSGTGHHVLGGAFLGQRWGRLATQPKRGAGRLSATPPAGGTLTGSRT